jgi:hypothetical protein
MLSSNNKQSQNNSKYDEQQKIIYVIRAQQIIFNLS